MANYRNDVLGDFLKAAKALGDAGRLRIVLSLGDGELCVCQITELLGLAPSTVSKHLSVLQQSGLIETRKEGRWIYCRLTDEPADWLEKGLSWVSETLSDSPQAVADAKKLKKICTGHRIRACEK